MIDVRYMAPPGLAFQVTDPSCPHHYAPSNLTVCA
jgi:hypothetical protein